MLPAYNRADTIGRAVESVLHQTFPDWELLVVDDGSTDGTPDRVAGLDPRLQLIRLEKNQGVTAARNVGLEASTGKYLAFLDSDDEWLPHHLELCVGFLKAFPDQDFVTTELVESFGAGSFVKHHRIEISEWYPALARRIASRMLDLPPGDQDGYLRVYRSREEIGEWARPILTRTDHREAFHYHGWIVDQWRWGWLTCLQPTVLTRRALDKVGGFDPRYPVIADLDLLMRVSRSFEANCLGVPTVIKHEFSKNGVLPMEGHLAAGIPLTREMLRWFEDVFWSKSPADPELTALRAFKQYWVGRVALRHGLRAEALRNLAAAHRNYPGLYEAALLKAIVQAIPHARLSCWVGTACYHHGIKVWERVCRRR